MKIKKKKNKNHMLPGYPGWLKQIDDQWGYYDWQYKRNDRKRKSSRDSKSDSNRVS